MAVQSLSLTNIIEEVRRLIGEENESDLSSLDDTDLILRINGYGQQLPLRVAQALNSPPERGIPRFQMWETRVASTITAGVGNLVVAASSSTVTFPEDVDRLMTMYNVTRGKRLDIIGLGLIDRWFGDDYREAPAGEPEVLALSGVTARRMVGTLFPPTVTGVTPSLAATYYRLPASMPNSTPGTEYPDADPKYHWLWIYGTAGDILLAVGDPNYSKVNELEQALLMDLAKDAIWYA